jgi:hypothetical protein
VSRPTGQYCSSAKEKAPANGWSLVVRSFAKLLVKGVGDVGEGRVELRTDALNGRDDRNRNAGSDQTIFDCRRTILVAEEIAYHSHGRLPHFVNLRCRLISEVFQWRFYNDQDLKDFALRPLTFATMVSER